MENNTSNEKFESGRPTNQQKDPPWIYAVIALEIIVLFIGVGVIREMIWIF